VTTLFEWRYFLNRYAVQTARAGFQLPTTVTRGSKSRRGLTAGGKHARLHDGELLRHARGDGGDSTRNALVSDKFRAAILGREYRTRHCPSHHHSRHLQLRQDLRGRCLALQRRCLCQQRCSRI
jgi:hypothetical protein